MAQKWPDLSQRRRRLRLKEFDYADPNYVYFLSLYARYGPPPFTNPALAEAIVEALMFRRKRGEMRLYVYCLMPDHLHLAMSPCAGKGTVSKIMQGFKSWTTRVSWQHGEKGALWERSFYDHIARSYEDLRAICEYILNNPVRKGLAITAEEWPYSGLVDPLPW